MYYYVITVILIIFYRLKMYNTLIVFTQSRYRDSIKYVI